MRFLLNRDHSGKSPHESDAQVRDKHQPDAQAREKHQPDARARDEHQPDAQARDEHQPDAQARDFVESCPSLARRVGVGDSRFQTESTLRLSEKVARVALSLLLVVTALFLSGCGEEANELPEADYNRAKAALEKALNAWKNGEKPTNWTKKNVPVRFLDDAWRKGDKLIGYEIVELRANVDNAPEAVVKLQLRSKDGKESEREALYGINLKRADQIAIGRDPMY